MGWTVRISAKAQKRCQALPEVVRRALALLMADIVGYRGELVFDASKPDGTPVKRLDVSALNSLGWQASTSLEEGIRKTYAWYLENAGNM